MCIYMCVYIKCHTLTIIYYRSATVPKARQARRVRSNGPVSF